MLNRIFFAVVLISVLAAAFTGRMEALTGAVLENAGKAVELSLALVGVMAFFLGLMRVAEDGGLLRTIAKPIGPLMRKLFPDVPEDHPAMSAMILNIGANMLGLANAATPFGIKAIEELNKLNRRPGTATNSMVLFLAINTAGLAILPSGVISLRAALGSTDAAGIFFPTWFASGCATVAGVSAALLLARLPGYRATQPPEELPEEAAEVESTTDPVDGIAAPPVLARRPRFAGWVSLAFWSLFVAAFVRRIWIGLEQGAGWNAVRGVLSYWVIPAIVAGILLFGWSRGVRVYESLVEGAKEGFQVALRIIPYLVAILVMVGMLRAAGGIDLLVGLLDPITAMIGMPAEALPMALLRPLSGSGAYGIMAEIMSEHGPDSLIGYMVSTFQGSTETTFYVLAVYFGAVGIKKTRHALPACLIADTVGILAAVFIVNAIFG